jgi:hypothetical protein
LLDVGFARGVSMPANANTEHQGASRLRGGGAAKVSMGPVRRGRYILTKVDICRIAALVCLAFSSVVVSRTLSFVIAISK